MDSVSSASRSPGCPRAPPAPSDWGGGSRGEPPVRAGAEGEGGCLRRGLGTTRRDARDRGRGGLQQGRSEREEGRRRGRGAGEGGGQSPEAQTPKRPPELDPKADTGSSFPGKGTSRVCWWQWGLPPPRTGFPAAGDVLRHVPGHFPAAGSQQDPAAGTCPSVPGTYPRGLPSAAETAHQDSAGAEEPLQCAPCKHRPEQDAGSLTS